MKIVLWLMFFLPFFCCEKRINEQRQKLKTFKVDLEKAKPIAYSSVFDSIVYLKLETAKNSYFGTIQKIVTTKNRIYIQPDDRKYLVIFSKTGNFLFRLSNQGRGPKEYYEISNFAIDPKNENIFVRDCASNRILIYDKSGGFISSIKERGKSNDFILSSEGSLIFTGNGHMNLTMPYEGYNLYQLNLKGELLSKAIKIKPYLEVSFGKNTFSSFEDLITYHPSYSDSIYQIRAGNVYPAYFFDFGKYKAPYESALKGLPQKAWDEKLETLNAFNKKYATIENLFESKDFIYYYIFFQKKYHFGLIDKNSNWQIITTSLINDLDHGLKLDNYTFNYVDNIRLAAVIDAYKLINHMEKPEIQKLRKKYPDKFKHLEKIYAQTSLEDNPIIMYHYIKKHR